MSAFCIVLAEQPYRLVFAEVVNVLSYGLRALGHEVRCTTFPLERTRNIVLAPHLLMASREGEDWRPPAGTIVYNFEPVCSPLFRRSLRMLSVPGVIAWDYALSSTQALRELGMTDAIHVPFAFAPCLLTVPKRKPDIDVVFVGSRNERRDKLLRELRALGVQCEALFGVFGEERERMLARARVVLNVHYWPDAPNEDLRIIHAAANGLAVSSEGPPDEPRKTRWAQWSPIGELAQRTAELARSTADWTQQAELGLEAVTELGIIPVLQHALAQSEVP